MRIAVVLFNLGGPDTQKAVQPFLFNLFNDPAIIRLPAPFRTLIAWLISKRREKKAQAIYQKLGGGSPILKNTKLQAKALEEKLKELGDVRCFVAMRYWHPSIEETACVVHNFAPDLTILLPLYPQFSTTTTGSSLKEWKKHYPDKHPTKFICCYPEDRGFIQSMAEATRSAYEKTLVHGKPRILFSAHGLPEKIIKAGDPYQWQCEQTANALVRALNIEGLDWTLCYQSRVGPMKWIGPATDQEVMRAGQDKVPLIIVPIAFVSEHSETLVEIDMKYRALAKERGVPGFEYVPAVSTSPAFIHGLAQLVRMAMQNPTTCLSPQDRQICPKEMSGCPAQK